MKSTTLLATIGLLASFGTAQAETKTYDFDDPKGVNSISFMLDAPLESISGTGKDITGTVTFDPENPEALEGAITLATESLNVTNDTMRDHMLGEGWLHAEEHPEIVFSAQSLDNVEASGDNSFTADLQGEITLKGVTKTITVPVKITHLPGKVAERTNGQAQGDLLVVRSDFSIDRSEFGIKPGENTDKVAETIEIRLALAGAAYEG